MRALTVGLTLSLSAWIANAQSLPAAGRISTVSHYDLELHPRLDTRTVEGTVLLTVQVPGDGASRVTLNRGALEIDEVVDGGRPVAFRVDRTQLEIDVPPSNGARATFRLRLHVPRSWNGAAAGREVSRQTVSEGVDVVEWLQDRPVPAYAFGFAVGRFSEVADRSSGVTLRYFADGFSADEMRKVFSESREMLQFFEGRSGVPFPSPTYAQVLIARTAGQEMAGLSLVSEEYGRAVLNDSTVVGLLAHEFSHQWWGNMVTCQSFTEFWLNEGVATFMAAAYREHRFLEGNSSLHAGTLASPSRPNPCDWPSKRRATSICASSSRASFAPRIDYQPRLAHMSNSVSAGERSGSTYSTSTVTLRKHPHPSYSASNERSGPVVSSPFLNVGWSMRYVTVATSFTFPFPESSGISVNL